MQQEKKFEIKKQNNEITTTQDITNNRHINQGKKEKNSKTILAIILVLILLGLIIYIVYENLVNDRTNIEPNINTSVTEEDDTSTENTIEISENHDSNNTVDESDLYTGWNSYTYNYPKITLPINSSEEPETLELNLKYPDTWKVTKNNEEDVLMIINKDNNKYQIRLIPIYDDGMYCVFKDEENYEELKDCPLSIAIEEYVEFQDDNLIYRRGNNPTSICVKNKENKYVTFHKEFYIEIYYYVPEDTLDKNILETMDDIFLSIKKN